MWQLVRTFKPLDSSFPHLVTHLANRCEADESLFRSEVIAICEIMGRRMASPDLEKHEIFPVCNSLSLSRKKKSTLSSFMLIAFSSGLDGFDVYTTS